MIIVGDVIAIPFDACTGCCGTGVAYYTVTGTAITDTSGPYDNHEPAFSAPEAPERPEHPAERCKWDEPRDDRMPPRLFKIHSRESHHRPSFAVRNRSRQVRLYLRRAA